MKYTVQVAVIGYAYAEIEANDNDEAIDKAFDLKESNFKKDPKSFEFDMDEIAVIDESGDTVYPDNYC